MTEGLAYELLGDDTYKVTAETEVNIPSMHNDKKVTAIGAAAFNERKDITSVTLTDTVTVIEGSAFDGCCSQAFTRERAFSVIFSRCRGLC